MSHPWPIVAASTVAFDPEPLDFADALSVSGHYGSDSEVARTAMRDFEERELTTEEASLGLRDGAVEAGCGAGAHAMTSGVTSAAIDLDPKTTDKVQDGPERVVRDHLVGAHANDPHGPHRHDDPISSPT